MEAADSDIFLIERFRDVVGKWPVEAQEQHLQPTRRQLSSAFDGENRLSCPGNTGDERSMLAAEKSKQFNLTIRQLDESTIALVDGSSEAEC